MSKRITMADAITEATRLASVLRVAGNKDFDLELSGKDAIEFEVMNSMEITQEDYIRIVRDGLLGCLREWGSEDKVKAKEVAETFSTILQIINQ